MNNYKTTLNGVSYIFGAHSEEDAFNLALYHLPHNSALIYALNRTDGICEIQRIRAEAGWCEIISIGEIKRVEEGLS